MHVDSLPGMPLSRWWLHAILIPMVFGFAVLRVLTKKAYNDAPPIPKQAAAPNSAVLFTDTDVRAGQQVFLRYGLMENGSIWGHGAYLGPDFSTADRHRLGLAHADRLAELGDEKPYSELGGPAQAAISEVVSGVMKINHYDASTETQQLGELDVATFRQKNLRWTTYFRSSEANRGLKRALITDPEELRQLAASVAWAAWSSVPHSIRQPGR